MANVKLAQILYQTIDFLCTRQRKWKAGNKTAIFIEYRRERQLKDLHTLDKNRLKDDERRFYGVNGDSGCGCFKVFVGGRSFFCIASDCGGWDHVSVSLCNQKRCPTWDEMCVIKDMFFGPDEAVVQYHPPESKYVNNHPYCLHLWRPNNGAEIPMPPVAFV